MAVTPLAALALPAAPDQPPTVGDGLFFSPDDYLPFERASPLKHEYEDGFVLPMSGASFDHNRITDQVLFLLKLALRDAPTLAAVGANLRVQLDNGARYVYPDALVVPDPPLLLPDGHLDTVLDPVVVVEVLSPSTRRRDKGVKLASYRALPSLCHYLLLDSQRVHAELYTRPEAGGSEWAVEEATDLTATLLLSAIGVPLPLQEVYRRTSFVPA